MEKNINYYESDFAKQLEELYQRWIHQKQERKQASDELFNRYIKPLETYKKEAELIEDDGDY